VYVAACGEDGKQDLLGVSCCDLNGKYRVDRLFFPEVFYKGCVYLRTYEKQDDPHIVPHCAMLIPWCIIFSSSIHDTDCLLPIKGDISGFIYSFENYRSRKHYWGNLG
jgi:hypothetical protein